jgi:hypothetical protein
MPNGTLLKGPGAAAVDGGIFGVPHLLLRWADAEAQRQAAIPLISIEEHHRSEPQDAKARRSRTLES